MEPFSFSSPHYLDLTPRTPKQRITSAARAFRYAVEDNDHERSERARENFIAEANAIGLLDLSQAQANAVITLLAYDYGLDAAVQMLAFEQIKALLNILNDFFTPEEEALLFGAFAPLSEEGTNETGD